MQEEDSLVKELSKLEIVVKFKVADIKVNGITAEFVFPEKLEARKPKKKNDKRVKYSDEDIDYIINSGQGNKYLAERFKTNTNNIIKLKYRFKNMPVRKSRGYRYKKNNLTPTDIPAVRAPE